MTSWSMVASTALVLGALLTGCGGDTMPVGTSETVTATVTATVTEHVTATATATVTAEATKAADSVEGEFPIGFPKKVRVADIPSPVRSAFEGFEFAVQVAPGVWTKLPPGATIMDAALGGGFDGFCASIKALEREYGHERGGSCW